VVLAGAGKSFCAGADLTNPPDPRVQSSLSQKDLNNNPIYHINSLPVPLIGAVKGSIYTGGFELALACTFLVSDKTSLFKDTHCQYGIAPCWGLSIKLQNIIGSSRASYASLSGVGITAQEALRYGLVVSVSEEHEDVLVHALDIADQIATQDQLMVRHYHDNIRQGRMLSLADALEYERFKADGYYRKNGDAMMRNIQGFTDNNVTSKL
jgi:enoyl-CoA hydratase